MTWAQVGAAREVDMKAVVIRAHGGPEVLNIEDVPDPVAAHGEVVVKVRAVALNHLDLWVRQGLPGAPLHLPAIPGADAAGDGERVSGGRAELG